MFFLSPLLQPLQGHSVFLKLFMKWIFLWALPTYCISMSHCVSAHWNWFLISILQHGLNFDSWICFRNPPRLLFASHFCCRDIFWSCSLSQFPVGCVHIDCHCKVSSILYLLMFNSCVYIQSTVISAHTLILMLHVALRWDNKYVTSCQPPFISCPPGDLTVHTSTVHNNRLMLPIYPHINMQTSSFCFRDSNAGTCCSNMPACRNATAYLLQLIIMYKNTWGKECRCSIRSSRPGYKAGTVSDVFKAKRKKQFEDWEDTGMCVWNVKWMKP